jgi:hypothetical protein
MSDLEDFDLRRGDASREPALERRPPRDPARDAAAHRASARTGGPGVVVDPTRRQRRSGPAAAAVVALVLAALVVGFWWLSRRVEPPEPGTAVEREATAESADAADAPQRSSELEAPLPPLDQSDELVRQLVGRLSTQPALKAWLATGNLARTFTAAVENVSLGASPSPNLAFLKPREPYRAVQRTGANGMEWIPDPASYRRYDLATEVFTSIDPQAAADVYRRLRGLMQEAFADLGYPDQSFESALETAFTTLLETPIPDTAPLLERHVGTYRYVDPRLENLSPAQKHLLRMGPDSARRVKDQLRRLADALDLAVD